MTKSLKIRLTICLALLGLGVFLHTHPATLDAVTSAVASPLEWMGLSSKIDTLVILDESSEVSKYGKGNHPGWHEIIGSTTLRPALAAKGIKLIGPIDKDVTGKFPPGVAEAIAKAKEESIPRAIGLSGGKIKFDVVLPDTEAAVLKKAGI